MSDLFYVIWSCASIDEARRVSRFVVEKKIVACASILPWLESYYMWDGKLQNQQETKVLFKTVEQNFSLLKDVIVSNSSYELPELVSFRANEALGEFEEWVKNSCHLVENR